VPVVHDSEVFVEGKGFVRIKQEWNYSKSHTGVLKSDSEVDEVVGLYLPDCLTIFWPKSDKNGQNTVEIIFWVKYRCSDSKQTYIVYMV
jgi:hypothetical protein